MLRTYGKVYNTDGSYTWQVVTTDANGYNDNVWLTTLCQCILLNLGESPFWANYGLPAQDSVVYQIFPDYAMSYLQQQFSQYFALLQVSRTSDTKPIYQVNVLTNSGATLDAKVAV